MAKIKFWLVQLVMVGFVSMIFGSPVLAHGNYKYKKHKYDKAFKAEWIHKKLERNIAYQEKKIAKYEKKIERYSQYNNKRAKRMVRRIEKKMAWAKKKLDWYQSKLDKHNAEYHPEEPPEEEEPPAEEEEPPAPSCSLENSFLCTNADDCGAVGGTWLDGVGCVP